MSQCTTTQDVLVKLEQAVERGDVPYLHALLINQNLTGEIVGFFNGSQTLLHRACIYGARECVIALLTLGANPHAVDENKSTPLHLTINDPWVSSCEPKRDTAGQKKMGQLSIG